MTDIAETTAPIRRYLDVRRRPTVVRLDELASAANWVTSSFYITRDVADHLQAFGHALRRPTGCGMFLIGQYGAGKSHWLSYITCQLRQGQFVEHPPEVVPLSLLNFRAATPLEDIVGQALGITVSGQDRRGPWTDRLARQPHGLLLVIDELSEFLRSKPDTRAFNEDVRFLQYLGEWAQGHPFWIVAAMQEGIEHTGELEHGLYRKIKDRYPLRFMLSTAHVKDLIQESLLHKLDGYTEAVEALAGELQEALPSSEINYTDLRALYPIHPATLELLEEVRDRFSRARGVIDFTITQLAGDPARQVEPFLDRPWGSLLTPDVIIDHFRDLFEMQPEFLALVQQFFPYYRKHLPEIFPSASLQKLADRVLKLLVLVSLSPAREGLNVAEAAQWLLFRATRVDPQKNLEILGRVLRQLAEQGRYIVMREGRYHVELRDDGIAALDQFLQRQKEELKGQTEFVFEEIAQQLGEDDFNPLQLARDEWQPRCVTWHFHERPYSVYVGNEQPPAAKGIALCIRLPWGDSQPAPGVYELKPVPLPLSDDVLELAALLRARSRNWPGSAKQRLDARFKPRLDAFRAQLRSAYRDAQITNPAGERETPPQTGPNLSLRQWLDRYAEWLMQRQYPAFERFAPSHGPLPKEAYRSLLRFATQNEFGEYEADEYVKLIREAYLIPMRLLQRQGRSYVLSPSLERHELVTLIRPLLDVQPAPALVYENVSQSIYGLVPDQIGLLLILLHIVGEIDIRKGRHSYRELFETLPDPLQYDQLKRASALGLEQLHHLEVLCEGLHVRVPKEWTVLAQRKAAQQVKDVLGKQMEPLRKLLLDLQQQGKAEELLSALRQVVAWDQTLRQGNDVLDDVQQFLYEIGSPRRFLGMFAELRELPERLERLLSERNRYQHLFNHPSVGKAADPVHAVRIDALRTAPHLDQLSEVEQWLSECRSAYEGYKSTYAQRHDQWWLRVMQDPLWQWKPPRLASSRHLGLDELLRDVRDVRQRAERMRCRGLVNLDFQPLCACGFDGSSSPIEEELLGLRALAERIDAALAAFFRQAPVQAKLRAWIEEGMESNATTLSYVRGEAPYPDVENLDLLDRHLAGVQLIKHIDATAFVELLTERTWDKAALRESVSQWIGRLPEAPLRLRYGGAADVSELAEWSVEQALRGGAALPPALRGRPAAQVAERLRPEWVSPKALEGLEELGLGDAVVERIVGWLLEGQLAHAIRPQHGEDPASSSALVMAAQHVLLPATPRNADEYARLVEQLYRAHATMQRVAGQRWLDRLDELARAPLPSPPPALTDVLSDAASAQFLLLDGWGVPLLHPVLEQLDALLPAMRVAELRFAMVAAPSTTDGCYRMLLDAGFQQRMEKINRIDALLHERYLPFDELARLAVAELATACRAVRARLDQNVPLTLFADHGFRLAPDGRSYGHGGDTTLERLVPVLILRPR